MTQRFPQCVDAYANSKTFDARRVLNAEFGAKVRKNEKDRLRVRERMKKKIQKKGSIAANTVVFG